MSEVGTEYIHRVKILNLPAHELAGVKKLFQSLELHKFKKAPKWDYAYMNFEVNNIKEFWPVINMV
jgi:tRNA (uracil-5-)-methyltransferase